MSRWDALQPTNRRFSGGNQRQEGDFSNRVNTSSQSWRRRTRPADSSISALTQSQAQIEKEWNVTLQKYCDCLHRKENDGNENLHQNGGSANEGSEEALLVRDLSKTAFSSKKSLSGRVVGNAIVMLIECSSKLPPEPANAHLLRLVARLATECKFELTPLEAQRCLQALSLFSQDFLDETTATDKKESDVNSARLECLVWIVGVTVQQLPAEETAQRLVQNIFVPVMNKYGNNNRHPGGFRVERRHVLLSLEGIRRLLRDQNHASAMLAPLVLEVSHEGVERRIPNPIRDNLLTALQSLLRFDDVKGEDVILREACGTLSTAMDSIKRVEQTGGSPRELDLVALERFLHAVLRTPLVGGKETGLTDTLQLQVLKLVSSLLKAFPDAASGLSTLVLAQGSLPNTGSCTETKRDCGCNPAPPLLYLLHSCSLEYEKLLNACMVVIQEFLRTMPLKLWLTGKSSAHHQQCLGQRVSRGLEQLVRITKCRFLLLIGSNARVTGSLCDLVATTMNNVIFIDDSLIDAAVNLVSSVGRAFMRATACTPQNDALEHLGNSLVECMGGRLTPSGVRTDMPVPVKRWLFSSKSQSFRNGLYLGTTSSNLETRSICIKILSAVVRTQPSIAHVAPEESDRFHLLILSDTRQDGAENVCLETLTLLGCFLLGRKEYGDKEQIERDGEWVVSVVSRVLAVAANSEFSSIRVSAMNGYGALTKADWCLLFDNYAGGMAHARILLSHCIKGSSSNDTAGDSNAQVRSAACKAIGNACTEIFSFARNDQSLSSCALTDELAAKACIEVVDTMVESLRDSNPTVRSMALFAVGNLAQTLGGKTMETPCILAKLAPLVCDSLHDRNEKVVGNAIRTSGHLYFLIFSNSGGDGGEVFSSAISYQGLVKSLTVKIELALEEATGRPAFMKRSWKQRSVIRKHAWGACNSLSVLLGCIDVVVQEENISSSRRAVQTMVQCLSEKASINEKVVVAAVSALVSISNQTWSNVAAGTDIVGEALCACLVEVYKTQAHSARSKRQAGEKLQKDLLLLFGKLVAVATISDVCSMLKRDEITKSMLEFLYEWMTSQSDEIDASAFESFALALQRRDLGGEVSLQQKFASRALRRYRNQQESSVCNEMETICILDTENQHDHSSSNCDEL